MTKRRRLVAMWLAPLGALLLLLLATIVVFGVHDEGFQLEGNAEAGDLTYVDLDLVGSPPKPTSSPGTLTGAAAGAVDWDSLFDDSGPDGTGAEYNLPAGFTGSDFVLDFNYSGTTFLTNDSTTFATGSKDTLPITPGWQCNRDNNINSKTDIINGYAALDEGSGDQILYFGLEKDVDNGTNNVGLWLFQDPNVGCESPGGSVPFTGNHVPGDLFLVSAFTRGGGVANITAYQWVGDLDGDGTADDPGLDPNPIENLVNGDCLDTAFNDKLCAVVNGTEINMPWKSADSSVIDAPKVSPNFFEGAINLDKFPQFAESCFTGFMLTTRSSQSLTATIFDYVLGNIDTCNPELSIDKEPETQTHNVGESFDWTLTVENTGDGPADDAEVTDSIPAGLDINSVSVDPASAGSCDVDGQDITCTLDLDPGDSVEITVNVTSTLDVFGESEDGCVDVTNTGEVSVDGDTDTSDNSDSADATICRPLVDKTAAGNYTHDVQWTIAKSVDIDQHTLLAGEDADSTYTVSVDKTVTDSDFHVTGTISIENPSTEDDMTVDVVDVLSSGEAAAATDIECDTDDDGTADDDGDDVLVEWGETITCTYDLEPADADAGTNTATVTLNSIDFEATAGYTFTATNTGEPETVNVTDNFDGGGAVAINGPVSVDTTFATYTHNFACPTDESLYDSSGHYEDTFPNTAEIVETPDEASESVDLDCYIPTISKTAAGTYTHDVQWDITKSVDIDQHTLLAGEDADSTYTVSVDKTVTNTDFVVAGTITISNPSPEDDMTVDVTDELSSGESAAATDIDCETDDANPGPDEDGDNVVVPAGGSIECLYAINAADATAGTNTATATFSSDAAVEVSDDAGYTFTATNTGEPETVNVTDNFDGGGAVAINGPVSVDTTFATYTHNFACPTDESLYDSSGHYEDTFPNTAEIVETPDEASESVDLDCYIPTISKTADASFDRDWTWTIDKTGDEESITLGEGESATVHYDVTVDASKSDSNFEVTGSITITNPSPADDMTVDVTDELSTGETIAAAALDCGAAGDGDDAVIAAGGSITCGYSFLDVSGVGPGDEGTNTATATFSGDADVSVSDDDGYAYGLDDETDECVAVTDTYAGELGTVCAGDDDLPYTFHYSRQVGPYASCGEFTVDNTATFVTNDTEATDSDDWTVNVSVIGCGNLFHTGTTCDQYLGNEPPVGLAGQGIDAIYYSLKQNKISQINPGVFFYYTTVEASGSSETAVINQLPPGTYNYPMGIQNDDQVRVYDANCNTYSDFTFNVSNGDVTVDINGTTAGHDYIISVKYDPKNLVGLAKPPAAPQEYAWQTEVDGSTSNEDSLFLTKKD